jgi:hypothetical protein
MSARLISNPRGDHRRPDRRMAPAGRAAKGGRGCERTALEGPQT